MYNVAKLGDTEESSKRVTPKTLHALGISGIKKGAKNLDTDNKCYRKIKKTLSSVETRHKKWEIKFPFRTDFCSFQP